MLQPFRSAKSCQIMHVMKLLDDYQRCNSTTSAVFKQRMFKADSYVPFENVKALCDEGKLKQALNILKHMDPIDAEIYVEACAYLLQGCIRLKAPVEGREVDAQLKKHLLEPNLFLSNSVINMYAKCGHIKDARDVFDRMSMRNVFTWTTMITGYVQHGLGKEAVALFEKMEKDSKPDKVAYISILHACSSIINFGHGKRIHTCILKNGYELDVFVGTNLVDMYVKCSSIADARNLFNKLPVRNVVTWNTIIAGYAQENNAKEAMKLFWKMKQKGVKSDNFTLASLLRTCAMDAAVPYGKWVHAYCHKSGSDLDIFVRCTLIDMYSKVGDLKSSLQEFDRMDARDRVSWNMLITGFAQLGQSKEAFKLLIEMLVVNMEPDEVSFISFLKACSDGIGALEMVRLVHAIILIKGLDPNVLLVNSILNIYGRCGSIEDAVQVFEGMGILDVVSWNMMIGAYALHNAGKEALELFEKMETEVCADEVTVVTIVAVCGSLTVLGHGKRVHANILRRGHESNNNVSNALIDMYVKCGSLADAYWTFLRMNEPDVVACSVMILGYAQFGDGDMALRFYWNMARSNVRPNDITFVGVLNACASAVSLEQGKMVHDDIVKNKLESDIFVGSALIDMYAKCGSIQDASEVFDNMPQYSVVTWNAMIAGYSHHGDSGAVQRMLCNMQCGGTKPNAATFVSVLQVCSYTSLDVEGCHYFVHWSQDYGITPTMKLYACIVDLFSRSGYFDEACDILNTIPFQSPNVLWMSLLAVCRIHCEEELAEHATRIL